ncbi:cytochrome c3 family protein [Limisalsivibrio acetivorans]|uniref:cytochrome c3 family protein n=1 Tax=Limisalsivibrio acetivorans TaxID=1304888 RepID=UPI0003B7374D|nr:cytochrome c3 family protein [Limisalsivibrio acetivorans]
MKRFILTVFALTLLASGAFAYDKDSSCVQCHGNEAAMEKLGYPQLYLDPDQVEEEVNMGDINCVDCHLGNNEEIVAEKAHEGMPRPFYAAVGKNHKYQAVGRDITNYDRIQPKGDVRFKVLLRQPDPEKAKEKGIKRIIQLFYHDRDPETMAYSPEIAEQTCGKCHMGEVEDYNKSGMGLNKYQRGFTSFTDSPPGPQNCGAWFGDNYDKLEEDCTREYKEESAKGSARGCNKCHASCNDCHYQGYKKSNASHKFAKEVEPMSCYGSGKGTICHAGPNDRRRGAGYMREEFAFPIHELPTGAHAKAGVGCSDCHKMESHSYGHLSSEQARESCKDCHAEVYDAVKSSDEHGSVDCSSCHIQESGAYQFTFWGPGKQEAQKKVYTKHKQYYGVRSQPTLVKHPETGLWIPLKPYPMGVMNIKKDMEPTGLMLRTIEKQTIKGNKDLGEEDFTVERKGDEVNDMYVINGTFKKNLKENDSMLAWIQMDKLSHALGEPRKCDSCHSSHDQEATTWYTYFNATDVKKPFSGSYRVKATKDGLFFTDWMNETPVPVDGQSVENFAPYLVTGNVWDVKGVDMSIPFDEDKVEKVQGKYNMLYGKIHNLTLKYKKAKNEDMLDRLNVIKAVLPHNTAKAEKMLSELK